MTKTKHALCRIDTIWQWIEDRSVRAVLEALS